MSMISAHNLSFSYGVDRVFDEVHFSVGKNTKVGLVGPNGAGKSTLLNLIYRREIPDQGKVEVFGKVGYVPQEVKYDPALESSNTIKGYLDPQNFKQDYELKKMLDGLELEGVSLNSSPQILSGGQKTKLALARALLLEPEILLLDEPTNFLDISGKKWVMNFLAEYPKTLILISHDIDLLDKHIDKVIAINPQTKKVEEYKGNYSKYLKLKAGKDELTKRDVTNQQKHIKRMKESLKSLYKHSSGKGVRQRVMLQRRIEKAKESLPQLPKEVRKIKIKLPDIVWVGELPLRAINVSKSYDGREILQNISLSIRRSERVALLGKNGAGKSTFIKILMGLLTPDQGEVIRDDNLKVGYYSQEFEIFDQDKTLLEFVQQKTSLPQNITRSVLAKFLFPGDKVFQTIGSLSGGEKTRLAIALLLTGNSNLLVLDEPTTYLDVLSQRVILEVLKEYKGAILIVSHTEDFISELRPNRALMLPENSTVFWSEDLLNKVAEV